MLVVFSAFTRCQRIDSDARNASKKHVRQLEERILSLESFLRPGNGESQSDELGGTGNELDIASNIVVLPRQDNQINTPTRIQDPPAIESTDHHTSYVTAGIVESESTTISITHELMQPSLGAETHLDTNQLLSPSLTTDMLLSDDSMHFQFCNPDIFERQTNIASQFNMDNDGDIAVYDNDENHHDLVMPTRWLDSRPLEYFPDLLETLCDTPEFRAKHLERWWKFQESSVYLMDPKLFMAGYQSRARNHHFSNFALNAMMACSLRLDHDQSIRRLSRAYSERAKQDIGDGLSNPNMSVVHAFVLLSDYECTNGREELGWVYIGIACRLVLSLGLHLDCSHLVRSGHLTQDDVVARQRTTFGCFAYEQIWCVLLGRPGGMKVSCLHLPRLCQSSPDRQAHLLAAWVGMSTLMTKMVDIFNRPEMDDGKTARKLRALDSAYQHWQTSLPIDLRWVDDQDLLRIPGVCTLYMQFCNAQILFHKTITANRHRLFPAGLTGHDEQIDWPYTVAKSQVIMHDNAVCIARALETSRPAYEDMGFPTLMLDIIFTAASTLILNMTTHGSQRSAFRDQKWLMSFLEACEYLQAHYPVVKRMISVLNSLMESTGLNQFIWRGLPSPCPGSLPGDVDSPPCVSEMATPSSVGKSASFDLKRWCQDNAMTAPMLAQA